MSHRRTDESGMTLVELLVVMVLMGILGTMVLTSAITAHRASAQTSDRLESVADARIAMNAIAKSMRAAVRGDSTDALLRTAHEREVTYLVDESGQDAPDLVRISVIDGELVEDRWTADAGTGPTWSFTTSPRRRALLAHIPDDLVVFRYTDLDACAVGSSCPTLDATATPEGLSRTARNGVDLVEMVVVAQSAQADPFELRTQVVLRNKGFVPESDEVN